MLFCLVSLSRMQSPESPIFDQFSCHCLPILVDNHTIFQNSNLFDSRAERPSASCANCYIIAFFWVCLTYYQLSAPTDVDAGWQWALADRASVEGVDGGW